MTADFVHLKVHSEYSLVDGLIKIKPLIQRTKECDMHSVAITERNNLCSYIKFYKEAIKNQVKPICGADLWLDFGDDNPRNITLLVMNKQGYLNLTELISDGFLRGQKDDRVLINPEWILEKSAGLIVLSGTKEGLIGTDLLANNKQQAVAIAQKWQQVFTDRFYIEIERIGHSQDEKYIESALKLAKKLDLPVVATNNVCFLQQDDFDAHEARVGIAAGITLDDPQHISNYSPDQYFKTPEQMIELFADIPASVQNTVEIAKRCNFQVQTGKHFLPNFVTPNNIPIEQYLREAAENGLQERLAKSQTHSLEEYQARLNFELEIIISMGFAGYFLIVADFIKWAKDNDIPVGPGRGSGAGSLVAYCLKITDLDPLTYDLLFERFLNPERVSMPDFDIDFCMDGRDRVIDYVAKKYGREAVSQIITFGSMAAKAVVRDVTRVLGKPYALGDKLAKLIPFELDITLTKARKQEKALDEFIKNDEEVQEIWALSLKLEGIIRNFGKHAGGVIIAPTKLTDFTAIACDADGSNIVTQFDKKDVEEVGLVKFDFLGLRTLTIIKWTLQLIAKQGINLDIEQISLNDAKTFSLLQRAETNAVFQLESDGMKKLIKRIKPDNLEDIIALVALFRPGPLDSGMVDDFIDRKHGKEPVSYPDPTCHLESLKPILAPTYGIILYQEQVMQIAQVMAGYSLGGADMLRRAMGKKDKEEMAQQRDGFIAGSVNNGIKRDLAAKIFDLVEKFAGYGFNKSHSAAYGLIAYQTAYLKAHFPQPFMAAVLSAEMHNTDKIVSMLEECRQLNVKVLPPCVNRSGYKFDIDKHGNIIYGLGAIKGIGEGPSEAIEDARSKGGDFKDLFDFCSRVNPKRINKRTLEALIFSGALDNLTDFNANQSIDYKRALMLAAMENAVTAAEQELANSTAGVQDLFGGITNAKVDVYAPFKKVKSLSLHTRLQGEKNTLGCYLSGHPLDKVLPELQKIISHKISDLQVDKEDQKIAGILVAIRITRTKNSSKMAFLTLDDNSAQIDVLLSDKLYEQYKDLLKVDNVLVITGQTQNDNYSGGTRFRASEIMSLDTARMRLAKSLTIDTDHNQLNKETITQLAAILEKNAGKMPVFIKYHNPQIKVLLELDNNWQIMPTSELLNDLGNTLQSANIIFDY